MDTPASVSPLRIVCCIGAAPRYFGSNEGCTLIAPRGKDLIRSAGKKYPKETTTARSNGLFSSVSGAFQFARVFGGAACTRKLCFWANCFSGTWLIFVLVLSGGVTISISFKRGLGPLGHWFTSLFLFLRSLAAQAIENKSEPKNRTEGAL